MFVLYTLTLYRSRREILPYVYCHDFPAFICNILCLYSVFVFSIVILFYQAISVGMNVG